MHQIREEDTAAIAGLSEHLDETTVLTRELQVVKVLEVGGLDPQAIPETTMLARYRTISDAIKNLAAEGIVLRTYVVKRRVAVDRDAVPVERTLAMTARYHDLVEDRGTYEIRLYVAVEKSARTVESTLLSRLRSIRPEQLMEQVDRARAEVANYADRLAAALAMFGVRSLGIVERAGRRYSEVATFFNCVLEARERDIEVGEVPLAERMGLARLAYPYIDRIEFRLPAEVIHGAILGVAEYPEVLDADALVQMLWVKAEFIACIGWRYVGREFVLEQVRRQRRKLMAAADDAESQVSEIDEMLDDAVGGRTLFGRSWFAVLVLGRGKDAAAASAALDADIGAVERSLNERDFAVVREDLALACSHWSFLPGNWRYAPRVVTLTNRNYAALAALQNGATGPERTPWGKPPTYVETPYGIPYRLALHVNDLGNTFVAGPSGSGKTVLLSWITAHVHAGGANVVVFDKDRGANLAVAGLGGRYVTFRTGVPTGINPVTGARDATMLRRFVELLLRKPECTPAEVSELEAAVSAALAVEPERRRLRHIADALDSGGELLQAMQKWVRDGEHAWLFDNPVDEHETDGTQRLYGFDMSVFLGDAELRTPVLFHLFNNIDRLLGSAPTLVVIDEFWRVLDDPLFAHYVRDRLATIRKLNGAVLMATQSLSDVIDSTIARAVVEQSPTKIFFGNRAGRDRDYVDGFGLDPRESEVIRQLPARAFLVRREAQSCVGRLDLSGLPDVLRLFSGDRELLHQFDHCVAKQDYTPTAAALAVVTTGGTEHEDEAKIAAADAVGRRSDAGHRRPGDTGARRGRAGL